MTLVSSRMPFAQGQEIFSQLQSGKACDIEKCLALINAGADIALQDNETGLGLLNLAIASEADAEGVIALELIARKVPESAAPVPYLTQAALNGRLNVVEALLDAGAAINEQDLQGQTALVAAIQRSDFKMTALLLKRTANPEIRDNSGSTALMWAADAGNADIVAMLLGYGADPTALDGSGLSAAACARATGKKDAEKITRLIEEAIPAFVKFGRRNAVLEASDMQLKTEIPLTGVLRLKPRGHR